MIKTKTYNPVIYLLILVVALTMQPMSQVYAEASQTIKSELIEDLENLKRLESIYRRVQYPNHPVSKNDPILPTPTSESIYKEFRVLEKIKLSIENELTSDSSLDAIFRVGLIQNYFKALSYLTQIWLHFHTIRDGSWIKHWTLHISKSNNDLLPMLSIPSHNLAGQLFRQIKISQTDNFMDLGFTSEFMTSTVLGHQIASHQDQSLELLARTLGIQQLLKNLSLTELTLGLPNQPIVQLPPGLLLEKLPILSTSKELFLDYTEQTNESLYQEFIVSELNNYFKQHYITELTPIVRQLNLMSELVNQDPSKSETFESIFLEDNRLVQLSFHITLLVQVKSKFMPISELIKLPTLEISNKLHQLYSEVLATLIITNIDSRLRVGKIKVKSVANSDNSKALGHALKTTLELAKDDFNLLSDKFINFAKSGIKIHLFEQLIENLQATVKNILEIDITVKSQPLNLNLILDCLTEKEFLNFSQDALSDLKMIATTLQSTIKSSERSNFYAIYRAKYTEALEEKIYQLRPDLKISIEGEGIIHSLLIGTLSTREFIKGMPHTTQYDAAIQYRLENHLVLQLQAYLAFGAVLGLEEFKEKTPTVYQLENYINLYGSALAKKILGKDAIKPAITSKITNLVFGKTLVERYKNRLRQEFTDQAPILGVNVYGKSTLEHLLTLAKEGNAFKNPLKATITESLIKKALLEQINLTRHQITLLATSPDNAVLESILNSSLFTEQLYIQLPWTKHSKPALLLDLERQTGVERIVKKYSGIYLGATFGSLILTQLTGFTAKSIGWGSRKLFKPLAAVDSLAIGIKELLKTMGPEINTLMKTAAVISLVDGAFETKEIRHSYELQSQSEELYLTSQLGPTFHTSEALDINSSKLKTDTYIYAGQILFNGLFLYYPFAAGKIKVPK